VTGWWQGLPGIDQRYAAPSRNQADRLTALACAARLHPWDGSAGGYGSPKTQRAADHFLRWLAGIRGDEAAYTARLAICIACTEIPAKVPPLEQFTHAAKEIVRYLTTGERR
jgi:hypothetical protein